VNVVLFTGGTNYFTSDVSMAQRLNVYGDVSMGSRLFVANDVSMAGRLFVNNVNTSTIFMSGGVQQFGAGTAAVPAEALSYYNMNSYVPYSNTGFTDVSLNGRLFVGSDVSLGGRFFLNNDASMNGHVSLAKDLTIGGNLYVKTYTTRQTITELSYQLIVAQDLSLNGRLFLSGGITPNYSAPSLSSDQVGYVITVNLSASTNSTSITTLSSISLTPGVWILSASIAINTGTGGQAAITSGSNFSTGLGSGCVAITYNGSYYYPSITGVATVTTTTTYKLLFGANSAVSTTYNGPFTAVRIA
jgi:hypothetical protein